MKLTRMLIETMDPSKMEAEVIADFRNVFPKIRKQVKNRCRFSGKKYISLAARSNSGNIWHFLESSNVVGGRCQAYYTSLNTNHGVEYVVYSPKGNQITRFSTHFVKRYKERAGACVSGDDFVFRFLALNPTSVIVRRCGFRVVCACREGISVMKLHSLNMCTMVTFIGMDMLNRKQRKGYIERCEASMFADELMKFNSPQGIIKVCGDFQVQIRTSDFFQQCLLEIITRFFRNRQEVGLRLMNDLGRIYGINFSALYVRPDIGMLDGVSLEDMFN